MSLDIWVAWDNLVFLDPVDLELILLAVLGLLGVLVLVLNRRQFVRLLQSPWDVASFAGFATLPLITTRLFVVRFPSLRLPPVPNVPLGQAAPTAGVLTALPIVAAGVWLGSGPAFLVGAVSGVLQAGTSTAGVADPFHLAIFGFLVASLVRQGYRGLLERVARHPLVACLLSAPVAAGMLFLSAWARVATSGLAGVDYTLQFGRVSVGCVLLESLFAGVLAQALFLAFPSRRPVREEDYLSPLRHSLSRKLLVVVVPLVVIMTVGLLYAVTTITLRGARSEAVGDLERDAHSAAEEIPSFVYTGQGLMAKFAEDERLMSGDSEDIQKLLRGDVRMGAFFDRLMLFGAGGELVAMYPPSSTGSLELTSQEEELLSRVLKDGAPQISSAHRSREDKALLSFLMPTESAVGGNEGYGCLIGRTHLQDNPAMDRILADLQWTSGEGEGFVVDSDARVVAHPDPGMVLSIWQQDQYRDCIADAGPQGLVCEGRDPVHNTRELLYYQPTEGYPWSVVIRLPYEVVLNQAKEVAVPLLVIQSVLGAGLVVAIVLVVGRMTDPLKQLANAAGRIAKGTLTEPIDVSGADEVGRLGLTLEEMRARLKDRMSDLSLLLEVSQAVSSTLDLRTGLSYVLEGALEATGADVARAVLVEETEAAGNVISRGDQIDDLDGLERALVAEVRKRMRMVAWADLEEATDLAYDGPVAPLAAAVALPVRTKEQMLAVVWLGYRGDQGFGKSKLDFLSMLTNQVAILVENARLFQAVEGERTRLAAILESVSDAVLVTDREGRLLLANSAAEDAFEVASDTIIGEKIADTGLAPKVIDALTESTSSKDVPQELLLPSGRVLYADVSAIQTARGEELGRVAVMRDITRFKELDEMKSEFLATVSHDLRAPLTFMRGYADRLDAVGELNDKQKVYVENILRGVQRIDDLVLDLLDLSRIEAGLGVEKEPCHLGLILSEAVSSLRSRAAEKDISLQVEPALDSAGSEGGPLVAGDRALLRQLVVNLLDNAIKYTPGGGKVATGLSVDARNGSSRATIRVADTGIGIAPDEQVRLFETFHRTKRGDKSGASGTGLGLAIVKSIVERHEGKVWVESRPKEGSTFYVSLPLAREGAPSEQRSGKQQDDHAEGSRCPRALHSMKG